MERRKFLRSVGTGSIASIAVGQQTIDTAAAATRDWINSFEYGNYDPNAYDSVNVEIYKANYADSTYRWYARQAAQNIFGQAVDEGYISSYQITEWNTDFSIDTCDDTVRGQWHTFRTEQTNWDSVGIHHLVTACDGNPPGKAGGANWDNDRSCYARTYGNGKSELPFKHTCAMEMLHSVSSHKACEEVQKLTDYTNDHALGTVKYIDGQYLETPMASKGTWADGDCPYTGDSKDGLTMDLSYCMKRAMALSAEHWDTGGSH